MTMVTQEVTQEEAPTKGEPVAIDRVLRADARRNRQAVIAAAKKLFAEEGLEAQMPDVARCAKVGVGTVPRERRSSPRRAPVGSLASRRNGLGTRRR